MISSGEQPITMRLSVEDSERLVKSVKQNTKADKVLWAQVEKDMGIFACVC